MTSSLSDKEIKLIKERAEACAGMILNQEQLISDQNIINNQEMKLKKSNLKYIARQIHRLDDEIIIMFQQEYCNARKELQQKRKEDYDLFAKMFIKKE